MTARLRRTARSFGFVFAAFWMYRLLLAPWIDPSFAIEESLGASDDAIDRFREADKQRMQKYAGIFPPGSWELDEPIMVESDGVELLMKDYENLPDGKIRISQCTMLYLQSGADDPGRAVILRAPEGAILQFDSALNLKRGKLGKLLGGTLQGAVTIHGAPSRAGADDELFIATRDMQMDERKVWSKDRVEFQYGPNFGHGNELIIHLLPSGNRARRGTNVGGFERLELLRDVEMHMQPGSTGLFPGDGPSQQSATVRAESNDARAAEDHLPVDIRCAGPFSFQWSERVASFVNNVNVFRTLPQGVSDRMTCEELQIFFTNRPGAGGPTAVAMANEPDPLDRRPSLQAERIVARGNAAIPVIIDAPSNGLAARASQVDYHLLHHRIGIRADAGQADATLDWRENRFQGRSLVVERPTPGSLPIVSAAGAGWLRIVDPDAPSRNLEASWSRELKMRPMEDSHVVSLVGEAKCNFAAFGELAAGEIHLWLREIKSPATGTGISAPRQTAPFAKDAKGLSQRAYPVSPERLLALANVRFRSPRMSGDTGRLEVQFRQSGAAADIGKRAASGFTDGAQRSDSIDRPNASAAQNGTAGGVSEAPSRARVETRATEPVRHFELHGERIDAQLVSKAGSAEFQLNNAAILGKVRCLETRTENAADQPIDIQGDWLNVQAAAEPRQTTVLVKGKPASIAARGMQMIGGEIHLDRGRNLVWIDGTGRMVLPARRAQAAENGPPGAADRASQQRFGGFDSLAGAPWSIDFSGGMTFDGKLARYERDVVVRSESQTIRANSPGGFEVRRFALETGTLTASLSRPIDFASDDAGEAWGDGRSLPGGGSAEVADVACPGPVTMTQRTGDGRGETAIETLTAFDLSLAQNTGAIHARGPGKYETTRLDSATPLAGRAAPNAKPTTKPIAPTYARVEFRGDVTGNSRHGELVLHEDVRGVYGTVERRGDRLPFDPDKIGDGMTFRADELHVRQTPGATNGADALEVQAIGNTDVDGQSFAARAHKLTYVVGKEQLVLEGDGRSVADLYYQPRPGGPRSRARAGKIEYWRSTGQVNVSDAQFVDIGQIGPSPAEGDRGAR